MSLFVSIFITIIVLHCSNEGIPNEIIRKLCQECASDNGVFVAIFMKHESFWHLCLKMQNR